MPKKIASMKHDALFKKIMESPIAAQEFLDHYLPSDFKNLVDLSQVTIEKESYVEEDLKRQLSDIVYRIPMHNGDSAFAYVLLEHQSTSDYWMALRIWKYMLLLCERHKKGKDKLPLVAPIVFYSGSKKYTAPTNLWQLFTNPSMAKELMTSDYRLIDLQSMSDDEIKRKQHLGMMEYIMKHIHTRDMNILGLWDNLFSNFKDIIIIDQSLGYLYIKSFLWYTDAKVPADKKQELNDTIIRHLSKEVGEELMESVAQEYIKQGIRQGIDQGIRQGLDQGIRQGMDQGIKKTAANMLKQKTDVRFISEVTGLSIDQITELKDSNFYF